MQQKPAQNFTLKLSACWYLSALLTSKLLIDIAYLLKQKETIDKFLIIGMNM
jgi:hypothetical protein